ncbi:GntR family transcriptional regulator [Rhodococcus sp. NPDC056960]|uniref:GntR family transcriptional regulator n=1 Tax=Rhodococcus sp. NPDC056960 TaxID=3345982 RepID=UPI00363E362E
MAAASKSDRIYEEVRSDILSGALVPGENLSVVMLSERFDASRTPVRQALQRLEASGLLSLTDRQGARVAPISIKSVHDLFELRRLVECQAVGSVARDAADDPTTRHAFEAIRDELNVLEGGQPSDDRRTRFYDAAQRFDQTVVDRTRNAHLARVIADLRPHGARLRIISHSSSNRLDASLREHQKMCDAIIAADQDGAARACAEHLQQTENTILEAVLTSARGAAGTSLDI